MQIIIGITGVMASGKSTTSNFIKMVVPQAKEVSLAGTLKDACSKAFNLARTDLDDPKKKNEKFKINKYLSQEALESVFEKFGVKFDYDKHIRKHLNKIMESPRQIMQYVGTEVLRSVRPDIHCWAAHEKMKGEDFCIVPDMRFLNEFEFFRGLEEIRFYSVYIENKREENKVSENAHSSEKEIFKVIKRAGYTIDNNGVISDLDRNVIKFLKEVNIGQ